MEPIKTPDSQDLRNKCDAFWDDLVAETYKPHFGDMHRTFVRLLAKRAIEAGIYQPKEQTK